MPGDGTPTSELDLRAANRRYLALMSAACDAYFRDSGEPESARDRETRDAVIDAMQAMRDAVSAHQ